MVKQPSRQMIPCKLRQYLKDKGYKISDIARKANITPTDLYNIFAGRRIMTADIFIRICKILDVNGSDIAEYGN